MLPLDTITLFFSASVLIALVPGPDNIFLLNLSLRHGYQVALVFLLGLISGLVVHTAAAVLGLSGLIYASEVAFSALRIAGALYLLYLAWGLLQAETSFEDKTEKNGADYWSNYRRGVWMNLSNPKVLVFFLAFLPQFVDAANGSPEWQLLQFGLLFMVSAFLVFGALAVLADKVFASVSGGGSWVKWLDRLAALFFCAVAVQLFIEITN